MLDKLERVWEKYPDLRLGQLVVNLSPRRDLAGTWLVEDDHLEERIDQVLAQGWDAIP